MEAEGFNTKNYFTPALALVIRMLLFDTEKVWRIARPNSDEANKRRN